MADFHAVRAVHNHGIQLDSVEMVEAGEKVDSKERQQNVGLAVSL
jgi:hypothetical protein